MPRNVGRRALFRVVYASMMALGAITLIYHLVLALYFAPVRQPQHGFLRHATWCKGQHALLQAELDEQIRGLAAGLSPRQGQTKRFDRQLRDVAAVCCDTSEMGAALQNLTACTERRRRAATRLAALGRDDERVPRAGCDALE